MEIQETTQLFEHQQQVQPKVRRRKFSVDSNQLRNLLTRVIKFICFFNMQDPFNVYKPHCRNKKNKVLKQGSYDDIAFMMDYDKADKWRGWRLFFLHPVMIYFGIVNHFATLINISFMRARLERNYIGFFDMETLEKLSSWIGNPFRYFPEMTFYFQIGSWYMVLFHWNFMLSISGKIPIDFMFLRLQIDPLRELRRVDYVIERQFDAFIESADNLMRSLAHYYDLELIQKIETLVSEQRQYLLGSRNLVTQFRPSGYSNYVRNEHSTRLAYLIIAIFYTLIAISQVFVYMLYRTNCTNTCKVLNVAYENCDCFAMTSKAELLTWIGVYVLIASNRHIFCYQLMTAILMTRHHLGLTASLKGELVHCFNELYTMNRKLLSSTTTNQQKDTYHKIGDQIMLVTLVKISVIRAELLSAAETMSDIVFPQIFTALTIICIHVTTYSVREQHSFWIKNSMIATTFSSINVIAIISAYCYAQVTKMGPLFWSILAQNALRHRLTNSIGHKDLIACLWTKLTCDLSDHSRQFSARPMGFSVVYKSILEWNFVVVSIFSLWRL